MLLLLLLLTKLIYPQAHFADAIAQSNNWLWGITQFIGVIILLISLSPAYLVLPQTLNVSYIFPAIIFVNSTLHQQTRKSVLQEIATNCYLFISLWMCTIKLSIFFHWCLPSTNCYLFTSLRVDDIESFTSISYPFIRGTYLKCACQILGWIALIVLLIPSFYILHQCHTHKRLKRHHTLIP